MQQQGILFSAALAVISLLPLLSTIGCGTPSCRELRGHWTNREGQSFIFQDNNKALWLLRFGSQVDTFEMEYHYDCQKKPAEMDLNGFQTGPLSGKTLYGILEWSSDSSFRLNAEAGTRPDIRPVTFEPDQTQKFYQDK